MGKLSSNMANSVLTIIVMVIIIWTILADTSTDVGDAASDLTEAYNSTQSCAVGASNCGVTTYPLLSFFKKKGVLLLAFIAGIVLLLVKVFMGSKK